MSDNIKILVACHKADPAIRTNDPYMPIQVGKSINPDIDLGFQSDNTGDNISSANASYCELTALYWGWKNLPDVTIKGLAHYRRYLQIKPDEIDKALKTHDIIIPTPVPRPWNIAFELSIWTSLEDTYRLINILKGLYPAHANTIERYFLNENHYYRLNMLIASSTEYDAYCKFLFSIITEFEKEQKKYDYTRQRRIIGYLGEPLLGLWIKIYGKRAKCVRLDDPKDRSFKQRFLEWRYNRAYHLYQGIFHKSSPNYIPSVIGGLRSDGYLLENIGI